MLGHLLLVVLIIIQSRGKCLKGSAFLHVVIMGIDLLGHAHFLGHLSLSLPIVNKYDYVLVLLLFTITEGLIPSIIGITKAITKKPVNVIDSED